MRRSRRLGYRRKWAKVTKLANRRVKAKERARREARMIETIKKGSLPYTPDVMSWLSVRLGKKSAGITETDLTALVA